MILVRHVTALAVAGASCALLCAASSACNAITGTGKYELVDCPSGSCGDGGGGGATDGPSGSDVTSPVDGNQGADTSVAPLVCGAGRGAVTLTVTGSAGSVTAQSGGSLSVSAGSTQSACLLADTTVFRTNGPTATWTGPSCKDGNTGRDRCEFDVPTGGITVTAALP